MIEMDYIFLGILGCATLIAVIFRRLFWIRVFVALTAMFLLSAHLMMLGGTAILAERAEVDSAGKRPTEQWVAGAQAANRITERHRAMIAGVVLALTVLSLVPQKSKAGANQTMEGTK